MKVALISGISGQDGSFLADLLLSKNYEVHGIVRRHSGSKEYERLEHIKNKIILHSGDLTDYNSLVSIMKKVQPDEIYNCGAMSFVPDSFIQPVLTANITGLGVLNMLEAMRQVCPKAKFLQTSTSELFGKVQEMPQTEKTNFHPRNPYAVSKLFGHWSTINYRESYGLFACCSIAYNHESIPGHSPIILNSNNKVDILPIEDLFRAEKHEYEGMLDVYNNVQVWNGENWTRILNGTCYKNIKKGLRLIQTRESCYEATEEHICFDEKNNEIKTKDIKVGNKVFKIKFPDNNDKLILDKVLAKFIGYIVGDGYINPRGKIRIVGIDKQQLIEIASLVTNSFGWTYKLETYGPGKFDGCKKDVWRLDINNDVHFGLWLRDHIYTRRSKTKRIPIFVLNADVETKRAFFDGYYLADGRNKGYERYFYKGFTTNSATLCLGLIVVFKSFSNQTVKCKCDYRDGRRYYYVQFGTPNPSNSGKHLKRDLNEVIKIEEIISPNNWFFDIQTESQTFATGPNLFKIHNSPRRGFEFVSRKVTDGIARIKYSLQNCLEMGNIYAKRDWSDARDVVRGIWLILQQKKSDDYVIASGKNHSVKEFIELAFKYAGMPLVWRGKGLKEVGIYDSKIVVRIDKNLFRPAEVNTLLGDASKARKVLGWKPLIGFKQMIKEMVEFDCERVRKIVEAGR